MVVGIVPHQHSIARRERRAHLLAQTCESARVHRIWLETHLKALWQAMPVNRNDVEVKEERQSPKCLREWLPNAQARVHCFNHPTELLREVWLGRWTCDQLQSSTAVVYVDGPTSAVSSFSTEEPVPLQHDHTDVHYPRPIIYVSGITVYIIIVVYPYI